jgi:DNA-binding CsgD family transcriptional regulator/N-acetylneuraminic acid mutarotase
MSEQGEPLSERELEILRCLVSGSSNKQIADDLSISPYTVKTHLRNIYAKLGVSTRTEASTLALQQGFFDLDNGRRPLVAASPAPGLAESEASSLGDGGDGGEIERLEIRDYQAVPAQSQHRWRTLSLVLLVVLVLIAAGLLAWQLQGPGMALPGLEPATPTIALFEEASVGDTRWLTSRPLPSARASRAAAAIGLDVYQIGGETVEGVTGEVQVFNTADRTWRAATQKPTPVADATAAVLFGEIYVPGGRLESGEPTAVVETYSPSQNAWRPISPLPQPIAGGLAVSDGSFLYFFGGSNGEGYLDSAYVYDPGVDSWRPVAALPEEMAYATGDALTGELYVVGGRNDEGERAGCYAYNPPADAWRECPEMLLPRAGAGATVLHNRLYVIGGQPGAESDGDVRAAGLYGEIYDPNTETWQVLNLPLAGGSEWWQPGVTHVETRIYAQGGRQGETLLDDNLVYSPFVFQTFIPAASSDDEENGE